MDLIETNLYRSQYFFDDTWMDESIRVQRVWHQATKRIEPVIYSDRPWENDRIVGHGCVKLIDGKLRIWYIAFGHPKGGRICYAESDDGMHWIKPSLGICEYKGSKDNNILLQHPDGIIDCLGVIDDPDDKECPFKMLYWKNRTGIPNKGEGIFAARSKDGIHWDYELGMVLVGWGDRFCVMPKKENGKYVVVGRNPDPDSAYWGTPRLVNRIDSEDLKAWSEKRLIMKPDAEDDPNFEIYTSSIFKWESMYLGIMESYRIDTDVTAVELCFSHDSWDWHRNRERKLFISPSPRPFWDSWSINNACHAPIYIQGHRELLFYYGGFSHGHICFPHSRRFIKPAIGLATLRIDGFCSLQAKEKAGWFMTPPVQWPGDELHVNVDARLSQDSHMAHCTGEVVVEVRNAEAKPIKGYSFKDCIPICCNTELSGDSDSLVPVEWREGKGLVSLSGQTVRLAFRLREAHLYSFKARKRAT